MVQSIILRYIKYFVLHLCKREILLPKNYSSCTFEFTRTFPATRNRLWLDSAQLVAQVCWDRAGTFLSPCAFQSNFWVLTEVVELEYHRPPTHPLKTPWPLQRTMNSFGSQIPCERFGWEEGEGACRREMFWQQMDHSSCPQDTSVAFRARSLHAFLRAFPRGFLRCPSEQLAAMAHR